MKRKRNKIIMEMKKIKLLMIRINSYKLFVLIHKFLVKGERKP